MELLDIFNENYEYIGTVTKEEAHKKGYWHQVFGCLFIDSTSNKVYLQYKSGKHNEVDRLDKLDISVGGHLQSGEKISDGVREIKEESSLDVNFDDLIPVGIRKVNKYINENYIIREFANLFIYDSKFDLDIMKSVDDEVLFFVEFDIDELINFLENDGIIVVGFIPDNGIRMFSIMDFIPGYLEDDNYYLTYLKLAKEYIKNKGNNDALNKTLHR